MPPPSPASRSRLAAAGAAASRGAQRSLLLTTLDLSGWNLTRAAEALGMTSNADVLKAARRLGLEPEFAAARRAGKLQRPGRRVEKPLTVAR